MSWEAKIIFEFVALKPKFFAYRKLDNANDKKCTEIMKSVVKKTISFDDCKNCLLDSESENTYRAQLMFRNAKHEIHAVEVNMVVLTRNDDKRTVKKDDISTLSRGHSLSWNNALHISKRETHRPCKRLVMISLQNSMNHIISWILHFRYQTSMLTLPQLLLGTVYLLLSFDGIVFFVNSISVSTMFWIPNAEAFLLVS